uniref:Zinc metalloproteinase-disintegrin-like n=1 Tax=Cerberus rynchops TaxID=46267 RepID=VM3_CERRY|nr:RecName: Full=Zinc metalloproteinase-disintegrin-like; AltName: Full=Snake venom metalloproteinase; Short=SVMP; Flags: Precursor [Cerberus rynchops]ADJ51055.1 venom metalloproteinase [Cerberus rynchops]
MIQALLVTICLVGFPHQGSSIILESGNVKDYEVVYPQKIPALPKGGIQRAEPETKYEDTMQYQFKVNGEPVVLHLERNKGLFSEDYSETHYSPDGREITTSPPVQDHCYYHGRIQNDADSTASISACNGLKGRFKHQGETYLIEPLKISDSEAHKIYKSENLEKEDEAPKTCGVTQTSLETDETIKMNFQSANNPEEDYVRKRKYIKLAVVVDNSMYIKYDRNLNDIRSRIYEIVNDVNVFYRLLNIHIALIFIEIWSHQDKINVQPMVRVTLDSFGTWRETDLLPRRSHDNAQLYTNVDFDGPTVGYAYVGSLCKPKHSVAIIQDHTETANMMASTVAHELGHNLGMNHDSGNCICQPTLCVMSETLSSVPFNDFSACSRVDHRNYLIRDLPQCILNKPLRTDIVAPAVCGNNFVEVGGECDCGSPQDCQSTCCDAATCRLRDGAQCDTEECCEQCRFRRAGTVCRAAKDDCDVAEFCTGRTADCPMDGLQRNGEPCQHNQGYCYNGKCPIMTNQCIALWGPDATVSQDGCFHFNENGQGDLYCRRENGVNIQCEPQDNKCGRLFCVQSTSTVQCNYRSSATDPDYGMVAIGTKCGDGRVCNNNRFCVDIRIAY